MSTTDDLDDADIENALRRLEEDPAEVESLLKMMNEQRIITWDEAERIMQDAGANRVVKSGLIPSTRPTEPENKTDVDECIRKLMENDPSLIEINLNNMKRLPIPKIQRMFQAIANNKTLRKLSCANLGLSDNGAEPLIRMLERNESLQYLNLETNYLSGDFIARVFEACLINQSLQEFKCVNQSANFSTQAEKRMIDAMTNNIGLTKVSVNIRLPEGRAKIERATMRNSELRRIKRREEAEALKAYQHPTNQQSRLPMVKTRSGQAPMIASIRAQPIGQRRFS